MSNNPKEITLVASGDLRIAANQNCWAAQEEMEKIFQPFYRSANAAGKGGFGLGLALSKRIIALHKGTLDVRSEIAAGTSFIICLPSFEGSKKKSP